VLGFEVADFLLFIAISLAICITVCTLAMEAAVVFVPAFVFLFPPLFTGFPQVTPNEAIGLAITVEVFGYTSSVLGYWFRGQVDLGLGLRVLAITVPAAVLARIAAFFIPGDGLLVLFGAILLVLAGIIYRAWRSEARHTCLLCGDSIAAMRMGDNDPGEGGPTPAPAGAATVEVGDGHPAAGRGPHGLTSAPINSANPGIEGAGTSPDGGSVEGSPSPQSDPGSPAALRLNPTDRGIIASGGLLAGLIGVAIGEITNTLLTIRKKVSVKISTGTAALVLHLTILAALATNLAVLFGGVEVAHAEEIRIPWAIAGILAPVVVLGGQIGSLINSRLNDRTLLLLMMIAYIVVGGFVLFRTLYGLE